MDEILPLDMKHSIMALVNKDVNIGIIRRQKEMKRKMHVELIKVFSTFYNFGGIRLYRNANDQFVLENDIENRRIFMYSRRNVINNEDGTETIEPENQIIPFTSSSGQNNEMVLFNGEINPQRRIRIYVMYI